MKKSKAELTVLEKPQLPKAQNLKQNLADKERLMETLAKVCAIQKQYGKTKAELETLVEGFLWIFGGKYPISEVISAIGFYCLTNEDIPAPSNIAMILDPSLKPLCPRYYSALQAKLKRGEWIDSDEKKYIFQYEAQQLERTKNKRSNDFLC